MVWHVQRDTGECTGNTGRVLIAADYELLTDSAAVVLSEAIWDVAVNGVYYSDEGGARYATQAAYDLEHTD